MRERRNVVQNLDPVAGEGEALERGERSQVLHTLQLIPGEVEALKIRIPGRNLLYKLQREPSDRHPAATPRTSCALLQVNRPTLFAYKSARRHLDEIYQDGWCRCEVFLA